MYKKVIATLRTAYDAMNADPASAAELKKRKFHLISSSGEKIQKLVEKALNALKSEVVAKVREIIFGGG